jgi:hypothetical protein
MIASALRAAPARFALSLMLAACLASGATATTTKHLYISGANNPNVFQAFDGTTVSYAVTNGRIAAQPDRKYPAGTAGPIALDAQGRLFAAQTDCAIDVFAPKSTNVERTLHVVPQAQCLRTVDGDDVITSVAVDPNGYLYVVLLWEFQSSAQVAAVHASANPCSGGSFPSCTLVYAPGASGNDRPLEVIDPGVNNSALALDAQGNLYVQEAENTIEVIADPTTDPHHVRAITPSGFQGASYPRIAGEQLYLQVQRCDRGPSPRCYPGVVVVPSSANGSVKPERSFTVPLEETWSGFAISGEGLYALAGGPVVEVFDAQAQGSIGPRSTSFLYPIPTFPAYAEFGS